MTYPEWFKLLNPVKSHPCQIYMWILSYYLHNTIPNRIIAINFHYFFIFFWITDAISRSRKHISVVFRWSEWEWVNTTWFTSDKSTWLLIHWEKISGDRSIITWSIRVQLRVFTFFPNNVLTLRHASHWQKILGNPSAPPVPRYLISTLSPLNSAGCHRCHKLLLKYQE